MFNAISVLFKPLRQRGYSRSLLRRVQRETLSGIQTREQQVTDRASSLQPVDEVVLSSLAGSDASSLSDSQHIISLVTTFFQPNSHLLNRIKQNFIKILNPVQPFVGDRALIAFRRNKNLRDHLVHARFLQEPHTQIDLLDQYFRLPRTIFNPHSNRSCSLQTQYDKNTKNIVYCIICEICNRLYVGETQFDIRT